ncbi:Clp protease N-terminal domain-containing protein [Solwaraspora sp. WMMD1047]|uniref:Clp protease N-terminal domain-containing protein n=1 Tax=Solwaraspora sp. WMMD1047 TaxID=3016102 RepID=UPI00241664A8|nr:Clp protease N-terminal domain-containing protein [Solwaraspora sp. WMMD1047]MDG4829148.1 Clp protease N-terminal domain-containing protein [Solwaraspora sp. WMMD1047]
MTETNLSQVLAAAYGAAGGDQVGTEHLLLALTGRAGRTADAALDAAEVTRTVVVGVRQARGDGWRSADATEPDPAGPPLGRAEWYVEPRKPMNYRPAARRAMQHATTTARAAGRSEPGPEDILLGLLDDEENRAVELLGACGVDLPALRWAVETGRPRVVPDRVEEHLRPTRDRLLGRRPFRAQGLYARLFQLLPVHVNYAAAPVLWARLEAKELARELGRRRAGSEHLLLAFLAVHEVARHYPHLTGDSAARYAPDDPTIAGLHFHQIRAAVLAAGDELGADRRSVDDYTRGDGRPQESGPVLRALLTDDSRAARLVAARRS